MRKIANHSRRSGKRPGKTRSGVAATELASACQSSCYWSLDRSKRPASFSETIAQRGSYEGVRQAVRSGSTNAEAADRANEILTSRDVQGFAVNFPNGDVSAAKRGAEIVVEVTAPTASNSPLAGQFLTNRLLTSRVVMIKE